MSGGIVEIPNRTSIPQLPSGRQWTRSVRSRFIGFRGPGTLSWISSTCRATRAKCGNLPWFRGGAPLRGIPFGKVAAWQYYQCERCASDDLSALKNGRIFEVRHDDFIRRPLEPTLDTPSPRVTKLRKLAADCTCHCNISCNFLALGMSSRWPDCPKGVRDRRLRSTPLQREGKERDECGLHITRTYNDYTMIMPNP